MDLNMKNLVTAIAIVGLMIVAVVGYYLSVGTGAIVIGKVAEVGQQDALNLSATATTILTDTETDFASNVDSANTVIPFAFGLLALVVLFVVLGIKFNFGGAKGGKGGVQ